MTKYEALKLALEALEYQASLTNDDSTTAWNHSFKMQGKAITVIKEALAQPLEERNFCPRCGKRAGKNAWDVHTCSLPEENT